MEEMVASAAPVLPGPAQGGFCQNPVVPERRLRKSGSAHIFQGVNLRQLRRLFHAAGEPDAEQRARLVWGNWRAGGRGEGEEEAKDDDGGAEEEDEEGLAQALVGLRVRARNRNGIRAENLATNRSARAAGHGRTSERSAGQSSEAAGEDNDVTPLGACGGEEPRFQEGEEAAAAAAEEPRGAWSRNPAPEKDPERYLHRIRH